MRYAVIQSGFVVGVAHWDGHTPHGFGKDAVMFGLTDVPDDKPNEGFIGMSENDLKKFLGIAIVDKAETAAQDRLTPPEPRETQAKLLAAAQRTREGQEREEQVTGTGTPAGTPVDNDDVPEHVRKHFEDQPADTVPHSITHEGKTYRFVNRRYFVEADPNDRIKVREDDLADRKRRDEAEAKRKAVEAVEAKEKASFDTFGGKRVAANDNDPAFKPHAVTSRVPKK